MVYQCHYPTYRSMIGARRQALPLHDRLAARGAYFKDVSGWERRRLVRAPRGKPDRRQTLLGSPESWFRTGAPSTKRCAHRRDPHGHVVHVEVPRAGPRRRAFLNRSTAVDSGELVAAWTARPRARGALITYTQWLNDSGHWRPTSPSPSSTTSASGGRHGHGMHRHVETWMRRHVPTPMP
jgi:glycine cleavage system aminomethyltransferase T